MPRAAGSAGNLKISGMSWNAKRLLVDLDHPYITFENNTLNRLSSERII